MHRTFNHFRKYWPCGIPALHVADGTALAIASAIVVVLAVLVLPKKKQAASL